MPVGVAVEVLPQAQGQMDSPETKALAVVVVAVVEVLEVVAPTEEQREPLLSRTDQNKAEFMEYEPNVERPDPDIGAYSETDDIAIEIGAILAGE